MKTKILTTVFILFMLILNSAFAQNFDIQLNPTVYAGGYNISCNGLSNGAVNVFITGGAAPFTYVWSNGATTKNISNISAGTYTVTVTSSGGSVTKSIDLREPDVFQATLIPDVFEGGYNINENGGTNGAIRAEIRGGVPPYNFLWSNGSTLEAVSELIAGSYSLTVTDMTNCSAVANITLTEPTPLHVVSISSPIIGGNYNVNYNENNGSINLVVAGGTPPYEYQWNNGEFRQNITNLREGDYYVRVTDANRSETIANITLLSSSASCTPISTVWQTSSPATIYSCPQNFVGIGTSTFPTSVGFHVAVQSLFDGKVGIGNPPPASYPGLYNLYVTGGILTEKVKIAANGSGAWSDFVFDKDYKLRPIKDLDLFIKENKHLPDVPTTEEVRKNGYELGETQAKLLQKIEENTLYIIALEKKLSEQDAKIGELAKSLKK